jgi:hypothetical protein
MGIALPENSKVMAENEKRDACVSNYNSAYTLKRSFNKLEIDPIIGACSLFRCVNKEA